MKNSIVLAAIFAASQSHNKNVCAWNKDFNHFVPPCNHRNNKKTKPNKKPQNQKHKH